MREASLYLTKPGGQVRCQLCSHYCRLREGQFGLCRVRKCEGGRLVTLVADRVAALHVDPIEKKPLFHFLPGSTSLSLATVGCNFRCTFCQNHALSQRPATFKDCPGDPVKPSELVHLAMDRGCRSLSYTYTEPTVFYELTREAGLAARAAGLKNVYVSNGYMSREAIGEMTDFLDAINIDLKSFSDDFYRRYCGGRLQPVLDSIRDLHGAGVWVEVTTLVIPGLNSDERELRPLAEYIASVSPEIPWHVSAFHPDYQLTDRPRTPAGLLETAYRIGREAGLRYVYCGNVPGHEAESTRCPGCGAVLIERTGFWVRSLRLKAPACPDCGAAVPVVLG